MRREPASFSMRSHFLQKEAERMTDTVDPIGIVGTGRVAQTLGRLLSENGRPVAAIPDTVAEAVTSRLKIPTIGIGAGPHL
jgi:hypothetical protein